MAPKYDYGAKKIGGAPQSSHLSPNQALARQLNSILVPNLRSSSLWTPQPNASDTASSDDDFESDSESGDSESESDDDDEDSEDELQSDYDEVDPKGAAAGSTSPFPSTGSTLSVSDNPRLAWSLLSIDEEVSQAVASPDSGAEATMNVDPPLHPRGLKNRSWSLLSIEPSYSTERSTYMDIEEGSSRVDADDIADTSFKQPGSSRIDADDIADTSFKQPVAAIGNRLARTLSCLSIDDHYSSCYFPNTGNPNGQHGFYSSDEDDGEQDGEAFSSPYFPTNPPLAMPPVRGAAQVMPMKALKSKKHTKRRKKREDVALAQSEDEDSVGKSTRPKHREGNTLALQADVRAIVAWLMGRLPDGPVEPHHAADSAEIALFAESSQREGGPIMEESRLQLDISTHHLANPWNKRAAILFAHYFRSLEGRGERYAAKLVTKTFSTHVVRLRQLYAKGQAPQTLQNRQKSSDRNQRLSRDQRIRNLHQRRVNACFAFRGDATIDKLLPLMNTIPVGAMSGDETDHRQGNLNYVVRSPVWRSSEVEPFFMALDDLHLSTRFSSNGRAKRGKFPHPRIRSDRPPISGGGVPGLPVNFYDPRWLRTLTNFERKELKMKPSIDLELSPYIIRRAKRFHHVLDASTPPLPDDDPSLPPKVPAPRIG